jgi:hypothetical protein
MQAAGSTVPGTSDRLKDRTGASEHLAFLDREKRVDGVTFRLGTNYLRIME